MLIRRLILEPLAVGSCLLLLIEMVDDHLAVHREARMRTRLDELQRQAEKPVEEVTVDGETSPLDP